MAHASLNAMHQDRHEADAYRRIELITGTARRRRWTIEEKMVIVAESTRPGVNVAEVARRFGVNRGLLQTWRRKAIGEMPKLNVAELEHAFGRSVIQRQRPDFTANVALPLGKSIGRDMRRDGGGHRVWALVRLVSVNPL